MERAEKMTDSLIRIESLSKDFGKKAALKNINLSIDRGDFLTIVGPSGSGKTTLLRLLDMLDEPSQGHIRFEDVDVGGLSESEKLAHRRRVGMVFQSSMLFNSSVFDNVAYPLRVRGVKDDLARGVGVALEGVGLAGFEKRNATTLSGGEAQRVSLAQAMIFKPELLLLDEPTANLDPKNVKVIEGIVAGIAQENGSTIVMSTHNMRQARSLSSKVAILNEGEFAEVGKPGDMISKSEEFFADLT